MATVQEKIELLHQKLDTIEMGGGQQKIDKQHEKGKMTARERLHMLFDEGSFTEISQFIHHRCTNFGMEKKDVNLSAYQMAAEVMDRAGIHEGTIFRFNQARRNT